MKIYSPSATVNFQRCPQLWWLKRQGWSPKRIGKMEVAAAFGKGISTGMETYYGAIRDGRGPDVAQCIAVAIDSATRTLTQRLEQGCYLDPSVEKTYDLIEPRLDKAIRLYHKRFTLPPDFHSFQTELAFPDYGRARADLLAQTDCGPCIIDFKSKITCVDYLIETTMFDYETSWQLYHYTFAARSMGIPVESIGIVLIIVEPFDVIFEQWVIDEQRMEKWKVDAQYWWTQMAQLEGNTEGAPMVGDHRDKYGLCPMYNACLVLDRSQWESQYFKEEYSYARAIQS